MGNLGRVGAGSLFQQQGEIVLAQEGGGRIRLEVRRDGLVFAEEYETQETVPFGKRDWRFGVTRLYSQDGGVYTGRRFETVTADLKIFK